MSMTNDYGTYQFTVTSGNTKDSIVSNKANLSDGNGVHIRVSMFFDGTNNNKFNTEGRLEFFEGVHGHKHNAEMAAAYEKRLRSGKSGLKIDDSYANDYSNVARLFKNYDDDPTNKDVRTGCRYIEGIGTTSNGEDILDEDGKKVGVNLGGDDNKYGGGFGDGATGIDKKVERGCEKLAEACKKIAKDDTIATLTIDVFGFSRGAAAARHFIYEITKDKVEATTQSYGTSSGYVQTINIPEQPPFGAFGKALHGKSLIYEGDITIEFAGIFDTVPAYRAKLDGGTKALHLNAVSKANSILHLTAMDERRKNFALTTIQQKGSSAIEKELPGVHCDIGGSYTPIAKEKDKIVFAGSYYDMKDEVQYLLEEGWYWSEKQLECKFGYLGTLTRGLINAQGYIKTVGTKKVKNEYSFIPLHIMRDKAQLNTQGVKFKDIILKKHQIPEELSYTNERLRDYVFRKGKPMKFYTRKEIDREIEFIKIKENPKALLNEPHVAKVDALSIVNSHRVEHIETNNDAAITTEQSKPLNANDYPGHPDLQRKINDHLTLMGLRAQYFHTSHDCSSLKAATGIAYFDPYAASIRTKPSRGINQG
ncbi:hypothetical protein BZG01_16400 [Labilibaculum manganireducens]|uniref:T6SS Phospholipase effector Tle1-like catalytic domain-containing protein n=1 Tax=Labilibaculum manganireducens TaxID=1940525 RepID=A0A2N3HY36_9BACT|nr:DUF2235 domain-containing protein [Labilibaculum manganireducens]PKQ62964.1 hypothetical protein BZG01_16400 [Labilibaculum manganireducens]